MLEYNVYVENFNSRKIEVYNIFKYNNLENIFKEIKKETNSKEEFLEKVKRELQYRYWSKCEWEIILSEWPPVKDDSFKREKIDVYDQIMLNWNIFSEYVWNNIE